MTGKTVLKRILCIDCTLPILQFPKRLNGEQWIERSLKPNLAIAFFAFHTLIVTESYPRSNKLLSPTLRKKTTSSSTWDPITISSGYNKSYHAMMSDTSGMPADHLSYLSLLHTHSPFCLCSKDMKASAKLFCGYDEGNMKHLT